MEHICIITNKYPTSIEKTALPFVQQLAWAMADQGKKVSVICPLAVNLTRGYARFPVMYREKTYTGKEVEVFFPKYTSFGQQKVLLFNSAVVTTRFFVSAVEKGLKMMKQKPDALYGHFITPAGIAACLLGDKYNIPAFIAYGESVPWSIYNYGKQRIEKILKNVRGIISVSTANKAELLNTIDIEDNKIEVFPNGYLKERFKVYDKREARHKFGLPEDAFIVAFVGHFIERKGVLRVVGAVNRIDKAYVICAGKGSLQPEGERVLYAKPVNPDDLAMFYCAADAFVLPTLNEGCCNAIIEAMACGLPIISSNLPFNDDILNDSNSIKIDPNSMEQIANAIKRLMETEELRQKLSKGSLEKAKELTLEKRAKNILEFMERKKNDE